MRNLRILCLHGYHGTSAILRRQIEPLAAVLPPNVELVYADAPNLAEGGFGWWHEGFSGWADTRDWIAARLRDASPRIDGIFGFSQGAALAGLLAALRESPAAPPGLDFEFAVMVGGFTSYEPQHAGLFGSGLTLPSVHVTGRRDAIVPRRDSLLLADRFADPLILEHGGGHVIPGDESVLRGITEFLAGFAQSAPTTGPRQPQPQPQPAQHAPGGGIR
jgi:predicted esterase